MENNDLISRAAALDAIRNCEIPMRCDIEAGDVLALVDRAIADIPPADAVPVRHGRWIEIDGVWKNGTTGERVTLLQASCCGSYYMYGPYKHCPNCGAKMDAEV